MNLRAGFLLALGTAAMAQDWGVQLGWGRTRPAGLDLASSSASLSVDPAAQQGPTLRALAAWTPAPRWSLEASLGWRGRSDGALDARSSAAGDGPLDVRQVLRSQAILGGLLVRELPTGTPTAALGAGLDLRVESLAAETSRSTSAATLRRPWARVVARVAWTGPARPFLALEYAAPLSRPSTTAADYLLDLDRLDAASNPVAGTVAKAHAPASELLLAVGLRFGR